MPGRPQITLLACLFAVALAGCGSDEEGTIPDRNSEQLVTILDGIEDNVAAGNCELAQDQASELVNAANDLPAEVDDEVKGGIQDAAHRVEEFTTEPSQCEETTGESGFDELEEPTTTTEAPTTTETEQTTTETEETTTTTETAEEEQDQPSPAPPAPPAPPEDGSDSGPGGGTGEGTVTIEPPSDEDPTSGGIGGEKGSKP
jgi:hypothetical protein